MNIIFYIIFIIESNLFLQQRLRKSCLGPSLDQIKKWVFHVNLKFLSSIFNFLKLFKCLRQKLKTIHFTRLIYPSNTNMLSEKCITIWVKNIAAICNIQMTIFLKLNSFSKKKSNGNVYYGGSKKRNSSFSELFSAEMLPIIKTAYFFFF